MDRSGFIVRMASDPSRRSCTMGSAPVGRAPVRSIALRGLVALAPDHADREADTVLSTVRGKPDGFSHVAGPGRPTVREGGLREVERLFGACLVFRGAVAEIDHESVPLARLVENGGDVRILPRLRAELAGETREPRPEPERKFQVLEPLARLVAEEEIPAPGRRLLKRPRPTAIRREQVDDEAQEIALSAGIQENALDGRVGDEAAVAEEPATDLEGRKIREKAAGRNEVVGADPVAAPGVEDHRFAGLDID